MLRAALAEHLLREPRVIALYQCWLGDPELHAAFPKARDGREQEAELARAADRGRAAAIVLAAKLNLPWDWVADEIGGGFPQYVFELATGQRPKRIYTDEPAAPAIEAVFRSLPTDTRAEAHEAWERFIQRVRAELRPIPPSRMPALSVETRATWERRAYWVFRARVQGATLYALAKEAFPESTPTARIKDVADGIRRAERRLGLPSRLA
jgi:hypothetical protein